ncbi:septal ring lytic transglycosylase RlpA family protein [Candidatus Desulfofervidus auxilii]|nr:septal ring lytic transglycosylase RlpA family protein [Candidatus Desulfofervidus auxilii]
MYLFFICLVFLMSSCTVVKVATFPVKVAGKVAVKTVEITGKTTWKILTAPLPESETEGIASWYGPGFHGQRTASGEVYNMYKYTAAHKTLPLGTYVRVINLENGKTVIVRINDRGPFKKGRIIDLSYAAAKKIGMIASGTARVKLDIISKP